MAEAAGPSAFDPGPFAPQKPKLGPPRPLQKILKLLDELELAAEKVPAGALSVMVLPCEQNKEIIAINIQEAPTVVRPLHMPGGGANTLTLHAVNRIRRAVES
jgi:hypothetical protein